jgi:hypothetical protein
MTPVEPCECMPVALPLCMVGIFLECEHLNKQFQFFSLLPGIVLYIVLCPNVACSHNHEQPLADTVIMGTRPKNKRKIQTRCLLIRKLTVPTERPPLFDEF